MAVVMIGVDPPKASHTAVVIGAAEEPLGELRVRASAAQAEKLGCVGGSVAAADLGGGGRRRGRWMPGRLRARVATLGCYERWGFTRCSEAAGPRRLVVGSDDLEV
jgi:hypothetical protein